jgi:hypothetical protein
MSRSYLVNLFVEVHIPEQEDWYAFEDELDDRYLWEVSHENYEVNPFIISASIESFADEGPPGEFHHG